MKIANYSFLYELKKAVLQDKILLFITKNIKIIALSILVLLFALIGYISYEYYIKSKANSDSIIFSKIKDEIVAGNNEQALLMLDNLSESGTKGYELLSYLEKSIILMSEDKIQERIEVLQVAQKNINLPSYYKEMLQSLEFMARMSHKEENKEILLSDIESRLNKKSSFYFIDLDIYAALLVEEKRYEEAIAKYDEIINSEEALPDIKERSKRIRGMLFAYVN